MSTALAPPLLKLLNQKELTKFDIPERKRLLGDWLTERHPCMVYAQTGRGKSLFVMSIAIAVAGGGSVFGWDAPRPSPVLYIDAEMDIADMKHRNELLVPLVNGVDTETLGGNLKILSRHIQSPETPFPDIADCSGRKVLIDMVSLTKPSLVILDNLSTLADIKDENDAAAFTPVLKTLWELRQAGCAVILVHHTGKQEGKYRGSSKLAATFESIIQLAPNNALFSGDTGFSLRVDKFRGRHAPQPLNIHLRTDPKTSESCWDYCGLKERELAELVAAIKSREFGYAKEVAEHLSISPGEVSKRKRKAISLKLITGEEWETCLQEGRHIEEKF